MSPAERVLMLLTISGETWTIDDLRRALDLPRRVIEEAVQTLRLAENPIATGQDGVRLARTADELAVSNRILGHRLSEQAATLEAQERAEARLRRAEAVRPQWPAWDVAS